MRYDCDLVLISLLNCICWQRLPEVFDDHFYTGNDYMYLTGTDRDRYKIKIERIDESWVLYDSQWLDFVKNNVPADATDMHFIKQGDDSYYVTVYNEDGDECFGYDKKLVGPRLTRCLVEYNPKMQVNYLIN